MIEKNDMKKVLERVKLHSQAQAINSMILKSAKPVEKQDKSEDTSENKKENV